MNYKEIFKNLATLFIPILFTYLLFTTRTLVDAVFISSKFGADGVTAVGLVMPFVSVFSAVGLTLCIGTMTYVGINLGRGEEFKARQSFTTMIFIAAIAMYFVSAIIFIVWNISAVTMYENIPKEIILEARNYIYVFILLSPIMAIAYMTSQMLLIEGKIKLKIILVSFTTLSNILFNYIFLFVFDMGIMGTALGTFVSLLIDVVVAVYYFKFISTKLKLVKPSIKNTNYKQVIFNGSSDGMVQLADALKIAIYNAILLALLGSAGVAIFGYISNIFLIGSMTLFSLADSINPILSVMYGKGDKENIRKTLRLALIVSLSLGCLLYIILTVFDKQIYSIFNIEDIAIYDMTLKYSKIYLLSFLLFGVNQVVTAYLTATNNPIQSLKLSLVRNLIIIITVLIALAFLFGINGIWYAGIITEVITFIIIIISYYRSKSKKNKTF